MLKLYNFHASSTSYRTRIVLNLKGLQYEYIPVRLDKAEHLGAAYGEINPMRGVPTLEVDGTRLYQSGAIIEYIIARHAGGWLGRSEGHAQFADYLYWLHFANASFQALLHRTLVARRLEPPPEHRVLVDLERRLERALDYLNRRLGEADYLAGSELTAADIMIVFSLTTMRSFTAYDIEPYQHIAAYLRRIGAREAYQRAMRRGDPGMPLLLD
jgi:glutathione S-transferase